MWNWSNLKNSWENKDRVEGWFSRSNVDNLIGWIAFLAVAYVVYEGLIVG